MAKARPGQLNYSATIGSGSHLGAELFKSMGGVNIVHVPYKGGTDNLNAVLRGEVQLTFGNLTSLDPYIKSGRLRALAVSSLEPSALLPGLPTVAASGLPGYEVVALTGIFAPGKTPAAIIIRLNQEIVRVINRADVKERFLSVGIETVGGSPEEFAALIKSEIAKNGAG